MNFRVEENARATNRATVYSGRLHVATLWRDSPTGHADAKLEVMLTAPELRMLADTLDAWAAT